MIFLFRPVLFALAGLLLFLSGCASGILRPFPPSPTPGPTITQVAEITPLPHPPTRTLTPGPETATWTNTPTSFPSSTATATETSSRTPTEKPSSSSEPDASATPTPIRQLPNTGGQLNQTATPGVCQRYDLTWGQMGDDWVLYFKCIKNLIGNEVS